MQEMEVARRAARRGGEIVARYFRDGTEARDKVGDGLVSDADLESEMAIAELIRDAFPRHAVLAEEQHQADAGAEHLWVVDPLDGTTNFAHGIPHLAVSVAYYRGGVAQCGVIFNPIRGDWFEARRGGGAWRDGQRVGVSSHAALNEVLVGVGFYYDRGEKMRATLVAMERLFERQVHGIRRFGTASLDLVQVGLGSYAAYFEFDLSPWDFAAGRLFVEEAGGRVTTCHGARLPLERTTILASNGLLHAAMLDVIGPLAPN